MTRTLTRETLDLDLRTPKEVEYIRKVNVYVCTCPLNELMRLGVESQPQM